MLSLKAHGMNFPQSTKVWVSEMLTLSSNSALISIAQTIWVQIQIPPFTCHVTLDKSASLCVIFVKWVICAHVYLMHIKQFLSHNNQEMNVGQLKLSTPHSQRHILFYVFQRHILAKRKLRLREVKWQA